MLVGSFFPNFGQGPFPKIAGKSPGSDGVICQHFQASLTLIMLNLDISWFKRSIDPDLTAGIREVS